MAYPEVNSETYSFVVEELDPETMCVFNTVEFKVEDLQRLERDLSIEIDRNLDRGIPAY